ncbi:MAG: MATE family efflux transporter [Nevskia sp.]|nr:MATE family efflux transporter [Nevskia sp.]
MVAIVPRAFREEVRANLKLALPLIAAQLAAVGMGTVDTIFAGRLGGSALAAVAVGVNLNVPFFAFFMGLLMACSPIVAQAHGAGRPAAEIGAFLRLSLRFALLSAVLWCAGLNLLAAPVLTRLSLAPETAASAVRFAHALSPSSFGFCLWFALRYSAEGLGRPRPILYAGLLGLAANALLDWLLLFGHFGLPRLGAPGCGVATTLSSLAMAAALAWFYRRTPGLREVRDAASVAGRAIADGREILRVGAPTGLILLAETGLFVLAALTMARFGETAVAAYQIAINFAALAFMIPVGISLATTVRVGYAVGAARPRAARLRGFVGMGLGLANAFSNAAIMALCGGLIAAAYTRDTAVAARAAHFLWLAAAFQFFDGVQVTANGALRGLKDTRGPSLVTLAAYWLVGWPAAWGLAFRSGLGADGLWWGLTAGLGAAALGLSLRFHRRTRLASLRSELMA